MQFSKVKNVKSPCRANATDAGIDFFVPDDLCKADFQLNDPTKTYCAIHYVDPIIDERFTGNGDYIEKIEIGPGGRILIPSGIHVRLDPGTALVLMNKSGVSAKLGLIVGSCVVDESYTGEVHLSLINPTSKWVTIEPGQKIVQGLIWNVSHSIPAEVVNLEDLYKDFESTRGAGGFGSSGTK